MSSNPILVSDEKPIIHRKRSFFTRKLQNRNQERDDTVISIYMRSFLAVRWFTFCGEHLYQKRHHAIANALN